MLINLVALSTTAHHSLTNATTWEGFVVPVGVKRCEEYKKGFWGQNRTCRDLEALRSVWGTLVRIWGCEIWGMWESGGKDQVTGRVCLGIKGGLVLGFQEHLGGVSLWFEGAYNF